MTSSKTTHGVKPNKNQERWCQVCKGLSSLRTIRSSYSFESPSWKCGIYPIIRSLINTIRPVKKKPYQGHTFALRNPLELDDDDLDHLKLDHLSWLRSAWWRLVKCSPIHNMGELLLGTSSLDHYLDDDHRLTSSAMGYMEASFWCMPMGRYLTPHRYSTHTHVYGLVHKAI